MADKTITQRAQGYSNQPVTVTVQIDGVTILQGAVPTQDTLPPALPDFWTPELGVDAWSWTVAETFEGTQTMTVSVNNGELYLCDSFYVLQDQPGNVYALDFAQTQGNIEFSDPFTAVTVNGVAKDPVRDAEHAGQWVWQLSAGDEFACTVNIQPPLPYIVFDSIPSSISPGSTGEFQVSIPLVSPTRPLPATYSWRIVNGTTTDADFTTTTGNVVFANANSEFSISTVSGATAGIFKTELLFQSGNIINSSSNVSVS